MNLLNCLTESFFLKERRLQRNVQTHALFRYSRYFEKSLVKKDAYFLGCTIAVQTVLRYYRLTNKQTYILIKAFRAIQRLGSQQRALRVFTFSQIYDLQAYKIWLLQGTDAFHEKKIPSNEVFFFFFCLYQQKKKFGF